MSPSNPQGAVIRFATFELDPETGELRKRGIRVKLADQPFRVLHYLAGRPGQVATREELRNLLWPDTAFIDADHGLNAAINKIREALGDSASAPRYIETIPRRGYRFVGEIEPAAVPPPATEPVAAGPVPAPVEADSVPPERRRPWKFIAAGAVAIAALGAWVWSRPPTAPTQYAMRPLTADSGVTTAPSLSRDGRLVAYASDRAASNNLDIWVHPLAQGSQPIRITTHPAPDSDPSISPDGGIVAFSSERDGGGIYVAPALGGEERLLVRGGREPRFSPDGKSIAYCVGGRPEVPSRSYMIAVSGGPPRELASDLGWSCHPVFSDDGQYVMVNGAKSANEAWRDWWISPVSGGPSVKSGAMEMLREQFRSELPFDVFPDFADGKAVFAYSGRIWELDISAPAWKPRARARPLTSGSEIAVVRWGAGSQMVFASLQSAFHLWKLQIDPRTGRPRSTMEPLPQSGGSQTYPSFSADGRWLTYFQKDPAGCAIRLRDTRTGKETSVGSLCGARPKISPDGTRIAYSIQPDSVYVMPAQGGEPIQLVAPGEKGTAVQAFGWTPDGKKIVYWYGDPVRFALLDPETRKSTVLLQHPKHAIFTAQLSPDQRWVAFQTPVGRKGPVWIAPVRDGGALTDETWIQVSEDLDVRPWWSPDGNLLYTISRRDGFSCIWAQPLDPATKRPQGEAFAVQHGHSTRVAIPNLGAALGPAVLPDSLVFAAAELSGDVWIAEPQK